MHHARRTVQIKRPLVRAASTATQPAPRPLGKWARPDPGPSSLNNGDQDTGASPKPHIPTARSWARPQQTPPPSPNVEGAQKRTASSSSGSSGPQARSWARRIRPDLPSKPGGKGDTARVPQRQPKPAPASSTAQRDALPHLAQRDSLPHLRDAASPSAPKDLSLASIDFIGARSKSKPGIDRPHPAASARSSTIANILSKQRIRRDLEDARIVEEIEEEEEPVDGGEGGEESEKGSEGEVEVDGAEMAEVVVEDVEGESPGEHVRNSKQRVHTRADRQSRRKDKERGSVISRLRNLDANVVIPKHARVRDEEHLANSRLKDKKPKPRKTAKLVQRDLYIPTMVSVANFAKLLKVTPDALRRRMIRVGMDTEASYDHLLTSEYASLLAMEFGWNPVINDEAAFDIYPPPAHSDPSTLPIRPPIVTIMGHVDHGKTTLLDTLRSASVAKGEAGGITQHIGAFSVPVPTSGSDNSARTITFLDTPGHAAFSAMRARGAGVTDIIVLVVAADDGIMPQTREVLDLIRKDNVVFVVAVNKTDKPGADPSKVERALLAEDVQLEAFGGDVPSVHVSGLTGRGLPQLIETISALAEMQDLRAEREGRIHGYVLESKVQKGFGPVATVLVLRGCLKPSDHLIAGLTHGKVRSLHDSNGQSVKAAYPGMAVTVSGWRVLPDAGDEVLQGTESEVKKAVANRECKAELEASLGDLETLNEQRRADREQKGREETAGADLEDADGKEAGPKELKLIIKADVSGSAEAVAGALQGIGNHIARTKIVATGVGDVTESDVMRAKTAEGMIIAFSVAIPRPVQAVASSQHVPFVSSTIIYRLMEDVKSKVIALLPPIIEKRVVGEASVLQLFDIRIKSKQTMKVAGCRVTNGVIEKNKMARVVRNRAIIHEGRLQTLKHHQKDVMEMSKDTECGMAFESFDDLREGDTIQMFQEIEKPGIL